MNKELYDQLLKATAFLVGKNMYAEARQKKKKELLKIGKKEDNLKKEIDKKPNSIISIILVPILMFFFVCGPLGAALFLVGSIYMSEGSFLVGVFFLVGLIAFLVPLIVPIVMVIKNIKHKPKAQKAYDHYYNTTYLPERNRLNDELNRLDISETDWTKENKRLLEFLPHDYREIVAVSFMMNAVKNCRADTLKEAVNLFEEEKRHWAQMQALQQVAQIQTEYYQLTLAELERNSAVLEDIRYMETINYISNNYN